MHIIFSFALIVAAAQAFAPVAPRTRSNSDATGLHAMNRRQVLMGGIVASVASVISTPTAYAADDVLPNGVSYKVDKKGDGAQPQKGELCAIRFKASTEDGKVIDDIFETPEPYYTRAGLGGMLPGVEGALPYMHVGDRWTLSIPVCILVMFNGMLLCNCSQCIVSTILVIAACFGIWFKGTTGIGRKAKDSSWRHNHFRG